MKRIKALLGTIVIICLIAGFMPAYASAASKVKLNMTKLTLEVSKNAKLTLEVSKNAKLKLQGTTRKAKWSVSNKKVAAVSSEGVVKAKKAGTAQITAKDGKKKYVCEVTVVAKHSHKWVKDKKLSFGGCTDYGIAIYRCSCGQKKRKRAVPVGSHNLSSKKAYERDLERGGWNIVSECKRCGREIVVDKYEWTPFEKTEQQVSEEILALRAVYPEDTPWGYGDSYKPILLPYPLSACGGFAWLIQDAVFGDRPFRTHHNFNDVKVGDIISYYPRYPDKSVAHAAVVWRVNNDENDPYSYYQHLRKVDGNCGGKVSWNGFLKKDKWQAAAIEVTTRW